MISLPPGRNNLGSDMLAAGAALNTGRAYHSRFAPSLGREVFISRDKLEGMLLGLRLGDALGLPYETLTPEKISGLFLPDDFRPAAENVFFKDLAGLPQGCVSDDTQLSFAILRALIASPIGPPWLSMNEVARRHVEAALQTTRGWGGTTKEAVERLMAGVPWFQAGHSEKENRGLGNGVAMKVAPLGALGWLTNVSREELIQIVANLASITHPTSTAVSSGLAQTFGTLYCLSVLPEQFDSRKFLQVVVEASRIGRGFFTGSPGQLDLTETLASLEDSAALPKEDLIKRYGGGSCYVCHSLPFTYAFFLKNPHSWQSVLEVIQAGGDTDSNGSMLGALLGALHGKSICPARLADRLADKVEAEQITNKFCERFGLA
jgi:ADP-ribosylglycohydrolase